MKTRGKTMFAVMAALALTVGCGDERNEPLLVWERPAALAERAVAEGDHGFSDREKHGVAILGVIERLEVRPKDTAAARALETELARERDGSEEAIQVKLRNFGEASEREVTISGPRLVESLPRILDGGRLRLHIKSQTFGVEGLSWINVLLKSVPSADSLDEDDLRRGVVVELWSEGGEPGVRVHR